MPFQHLFTKSSHPCTVLALVLNGPSIDLRQRVVDYVERGGSKVAAARVFNVSRGTIYNWFDRESLIPTKVIRRNRKLDWKILREDVINTNHQK